jgi:hypothetical protein
MLFARRRVFLSVDVNVCNIADSSIKNWVCGMVNQAEFSLKKHSIGVGDRFGYQGAALLKEIYAQAYEQRDDLIAPYREVLDIDVGKLPLPEEIACWPGQALADSITHRPAEPLYNRHMRQLMHVAYKLAAEKKERFFPALERCRAVISQRVTENLFVNHLQPLFIG